MRKIFLFLFLLISSVSIKAQQADQTVGQLINSQNWMGLYSQYPQLKSQMQSAMLRDIADAMLGYNFNQPEQAMTAINDLMNNHQAELGAQNMYTFILILAKVMRQHGQYANAAAMMSNVLPALAAQPKTGLVGALFEYNKELQAVKDLQPIGFSGPDHDVVVPSDADWNLPVTINGKSNAFKLNVANEYSTITRDLAASLGLKIFPDTVEHLGQKVQLALIGEMNIGELKVKNFIVDIPLTGTATTTIGRDFLRAVGETQLDFDKKQVIFPKDFTPQPSTGPNITWDTPFSISSDHHKVAINYKDMFVKEIGDESTSKLSGEHSLGEVSVTAARRLVKTDIGKLTYDVQGDEESRTKSIFDILRKVPMVTIDGQDNVLVKGTSSYKIYRNGHIDPTLSGATAKDILKAIPASSIKKIEVITEPGSKYDAEGTASILNIVTLDNSQMRGTTATLSSTVNNNGTSQSSAFVATQIGKLILSANYGFSHYAPRESRAETRSLLTYKSDGQQLETTNHGQSHGDVHYLNFGASYDIDSLNLLSLSAGGYFLPYKSDGYSLISRSNGDGSPLYSYMQTSQMPKLNYKSYNFRLDYQHKTHREGEVLTVGYMFNGTNSSSRTEDSFLASGNNPLPFGYTDYARRTKDNFFEHTFQLDYVMPMGKYNKLETGVKYIHRLSKNSTAQDYNIDNASLLSRFDHTMDIAAAYAEWEYKAKHWALRPGLRYEFSYLKGMFPDGSQQKYHRSLNDWVPSMSIQYKPDDNNSLQMSYAMSINRPGITYLNPTVISQPESRSFGNPDLKSSHSNQLSLTWTSIGSKYSNQLMAAYGFTNNFLTNIETADNDIRVTTFSNALHVKMAALMEFFQWMPKAGTRLSLNGTAGWMEDYAPVMSVSNRGWYGNAGGNLTQKLFWKILMNIGGSFSFGHNLSGLYGRTANYHSDYLSFQRSFLKDDRLTVSLYAVCPFEGHRVQTQYTTQGDYTGFTRTVNVSRQFGVTLSLRLGNLKQNVKQVDKEIKNTDVVGGLKAPNEN